MTVNTYKRVQYLVYTFKKLHYWQLPSGLILPFIHIHCVFDTTRGRICAGYENNIRSEQLKRGLLSFISNIHQVAPIRHVFISCSFSFSRRYDAGVCRWFCATHGRCGCNDRATSSGQRYDRRLDK